MFEAAFWKTMLGAVGVLALSGIPFMLWMRRRALRLSRRARGGVLESESVNSPDSWEDASSRFIDDYIPDAEEVEERTAESASDPVGAWRSADSLDDMEEGVRIIGEGSREAAREEEVLPPEEMAHPSDVEQSSPGVDESPDAPWWEGLSTPLDAEYPRGADELPGAALGEPSRLPARDEHDEDALADEEILQAAEVNQGANAPLRIRIPAVSEVREEQVADADATGDEEEVEEVLRLTRESEGVAEAPPDPAPAEPAGVADEEPDAARESSPEPVPGEPVDEQPPSADEEPVLAEEAAEAVAADAGNREHDGESAAPESEEKAASTAEEDVISLIRRERAEDGVSQTDDLQEEEEAEAEEDDETADFPLDDTEELVSGQAPPAVTDEAPLNTPTELIRDLVADVCPGELLLAENLEQKLPAWTPGVVNAAGIDLVQREKTRQMPASEEYLRLAILEMILGRVQDATNHLKESLRRTSRLGPVLNALAVASYLREKVDPAISYSREALREAGRDVSAQAAISRNLGYFYLSKGDDEKAAEFYEKALDYIGPEGEIRQLASLRMRVGRLFRRLGNKAKAGDHLSEAAHFFHRLGDKRNEARAHTALASVLSETGDFDAAQASLDEALNLCQKIEDKAGEALVYGQMGVSFAAQEQFTRALRYYENALRLNRGLENRKGEAANLSGMGNIHYARGDLPEAREAYEAALEINREQGSVLAQAVALGSLGRVHFDGREWEASRERLIEARGIFQELGASEAFESVAEILRDLEKHRGA